MNIYSYIFATKAKFSKEATCNDFTVMFSLKTLCLLFILKLLGKIFKHLDMFLCDFLN